MEWNEFLTWAVLVLTLLGGGSTAWGFRRQGRDMVSGALAGALVALVLGAIIKAVVQSFDQRVLPGLLIGLPGSALAVLLPALLIGRLPPLTKRCPDCEQSVQANSLICPTCNHRFPSSSKTGLSGYYANLIPQHRRSWLLVAFYLAFLLLFSYADFGYNLAGQTVFRGIFLGMLVFLVASGLSLIFGLLDVLNFAQGAFLLIAAYVGFFTYDALDELSNGLRFAAAMGAGLLVVSVMGALIETILIRPLYSRPVFQIVLTFGLGSIMLDVVKRISDPDDQPPISPPDFLSGQFTLFGQQLNVYRLFIIGLGLLMMIGVFLLLNKTRIGIIIRAGVQDSEMVQALGINVMQVFTLVFVLGSALAALGGVALVPTEGATLQMGSRYLTLAIVVVVIGGMGSYEGTAIASIIVGLTRAVTEQLSLNRFGEPVLAEVSILILMIVVLLIQPSGLFGREAS